MQAVTGIPVYYKYGDTDDTSVPIGSADIDEHGVITMRLRASEQQKLTGNEIIDFSFAYREAPAVYDVMSALKGLVNDLSRPTSLSFHSMLKIHVDEWNRARVSFPDPDNEPAFSAEPRDKALWLMGQACVLYDELTGGIELVEGCQRLVILGSAVLEGRM